jgi:GH15 family glucan-1,4-alpha-glucosidase
VHLPLPRLHALLVLTALVLGLVTPARAQTEPPCFDAAEETPERYGPTDISAVSANGRMSVALNQDATVTVMKWPSPSFYDQIKYRTTDRRRPRMGARPNEGAFLGIAHRPNKTSKWNFSWLRQWSSRQSFLDDDSDAVVTRFRKRSVGLTVKLTDVVRADLDVLYRRLTISRTPNSNVRLVRVISFANFNPVFSKTAQSPTNDWCNEEDEDDGGAYVPKRDAIVHSRTGTDASTGDESSIGVAMGFVSKSDGHQVGTDSYVGNGTGGSAYDGASDGRLSGRNSALGQADAALADDISLKRRLSGSTTVILSANPTRSTALEVLGEARFMSAPTAVRRKGRYWRAWLRSADLPKGAPGAVTRLAKRSLITMRQATDLGTNMIVASIATQSPYGVDWIRDGLWVNRALDLAGQHFVVGAHNRRYAQLQATAANPPPGGAVIPAGNWAQNYYADGIVGGSIPYEIDETGFGIFTLWDHYVQSNDRDYLVQAPVYEAIQRAAHYLTDDPPFGCRDPVTNLQCSANEGDNEDPSQTLVGAQAVWLGLDAAVRAAKVRGGAIADQNVTKWGDRKIELRAAIDTNFFDETCRCYTRDYEVGGALLWPVGMLDYGSTRSDRQADVNWRHMQRVFSGKTKAGRLEAKMLLGNAYAWKGTSELKKVRRGLKWIARVPTTNETGLLGEAWMVFPKGGPVTTMVSQPHTPSHAMFYLAALKAFGTKRYSFD